MKIYKFYTEWCGHCKRVSKILEESDLKDKITSVDCAEEEELTEKYKIKNLPTILITNDEGKELSRLTGSITIDKIKAEISKYES